MLPLHFVPLQHFGDPGKEQGSGHYLEPPEAQNNVLQNNLFCFKIMFKRCFKLRLFEIDNIKNFMRGLFISALFDELEIRQALFRTKLTLSIEGKINRDWLSTDENEMVSSEYVKWKEIKPTAANFIKGGRAPSAIKLVFSVSPEKTEKILPEAKALFLNILYSDKKLTCTTGLALKTFSTDKKYELIWDEYIENFLKKNSLI